MGEYLEHMRERFSEHTVAVSPEVLPALVPIRTSMQQEPRTHLQTLISNLDHRSPETYDAHTADPSTGLLRRGLSRAFDEMGHNTNGFDTLVGKANPDIGSESHIIRRIHEDCDTQQIFHSTPYHSKGPASAIRSPNRLSRWVSDVIHLFFYPLIERLIRFLMFVLIS
jgi:hypothetical protein